MARSLKRVEQLGVKIAASEGAVETLAAEDFSRHYRDSTCEYVPLDVQRQTNKATLTMEPDYKGPSAFTCNWTEELVGGNSSTPPPWDATIKMCGFQRSAVKRIAVGAVSGGAGAGFRTPQIIGNNTTQGSATKTGRVVAFATIASVNYIYYVPLTGTFASADVISNYGATPQASATASASPVDRGYRYTPLTETSASPPPDATIEARDGVDVFKGAGCRASATLQLQHGTIPSLAVQARGVGIFDNIDNELIEAGFVSGVTLPPKPGRTAVTGKVVDVFRFGDYAPFMTQMNVAIENQIADNATISEGGIIAYQTDGLRTGYGAAIIGGRSVSASVDPLRPAQATFPIVKLLTGGDTFAVTAMIGSIRAATDQAIAVYAPKAQFGGTIGDGERNGARAVSGTLKLAGDADDEIEIAVLYG